MVTFLEMDVERNDQLYPLNHRKKDTGPMKIGNHVK